MNDELETGWQDSLPEDLKGNETLAERQDCSSRRRRESRGT
jgi:hypothetical protein